MQVSMQSIREIVILKCFNDSELKELASAGELKVVAPYANVIIEGELSWGLYLILDGTVGVFKSSNQGDTNYDIGQLERGSFFGEMSLVDDNPRSATIRALKKSELFYLSKEAFQSFLSKSPERKSRFQDHCISLLVGRLRQLNDSFVVSQYQLWKHALSQSKKEAA